MSTNFADYKNIWVYAEQRDGKLMNVALELIGEGHKLSRDISADTKVCALIVGNNVEHLAQECFEYGADQVYLIEDPLLENFTTDGYTKVISDAIVEYKPEIDIYLGVFNSLIAVSMQGSAISITSYPSSSCLSTVTFFLSSLISNF